MRRYPPAASAAGRGAPLEGNEILGKLLKGLAPGKYYDVSSPEQIRLPEKGGIWIHPVGRKLRVHYGEEITETVLLR